MGKLSNFLFSKDPHPPRSASDSQKLWLCLKYNIGDTLHRIRDLLEAQFNTTSEAHVELLSQLWRVNQKDNPLTVPHEGWKALGFQGLDPTTDLRAGGLLSMLNLAHLAVIHRGAYCTMLAEIAEREATEGTAGFYPVCTTAINITKRICDALLISQQRKQAVSKADLVALLEVPEPASPLWLMVTDENCMRVLHTLCVADFHVRFMREKAGYFDCGRVLDDVMHNLLHLGAHCHSLEALRRIYRNDIEIDALLCIWEHFLDGPAGRKEWEAERVFAMHRTRTRMLEEDLKRLNDEFGCRHVF